uniref:DH domain-containing protein n=1 Tax=Clastoptera arizonana TaxID=38151 RepID=A0A1B6BZ31_9HEMI
MEDATKSAVRRRKSDRHTRNVEDPSTKRRSSMSSIMNMYGRVQRLYQATEPGPSDVGGPIIVGTNSPVNKRRVFSGRKWLPPPLRKLSGGKVDKNGGSDRPPLKKTPSDKKFKSHICEMENKYVGLESGGEDESLKDHNGEEAEEELELPPPMKPITEPILIPTDDVQGQRSSSLSLEGATTADLAEIEQIVKERMEQHNEKQSKLSVSDLANEEPVFQKREHVIQELVETERDYVKDLKKVIEGYITLMRDPECDIVMPDDLRDGKDKIIFGNIEAIYEWHRDCFLKALEGCIPHPEHLGPLFKRYERKLLMYVVYCQNKPVSDYIVSEYIDTYFEDLRVKLGHKLQLNDLLIKPVQRIMKYQLLLKELYKCAEKAKLTVEIEALRQATDIMHIVPKAANDMMDVGRLQGFEGKITAQGKLLLHGPLLCMEGTSGVNFKGKELHVFLFEQNIIFSETVGKKTQFTNPKYIYKNQIQVNKMSLDELTSDDKEISNLFCVKSTDPKTPMLAYVCQAATSKLRSDWLHNLRSILQTQRDFLKALQSPIAYQKELTKDPS